jgi:hypothetical protein
MKLWSDVFSKSKMREDIFYIKNSFADLIFNEICQNFESRVESIETGSPINASTFEWYVPFLDGGLIRYTGKYFVGPRGSYIIGYKALRFICALIKIRPPQKFLKGEVEAFTVQDLHSEATLELADELEMIQKKQKDLRALWCNIINN